MFDNQERAFIAINESGVICMDSRMSNRHGLIAGATGTGKTVTLQNLAETFSQMGVPVFAADIKGDLSGIAAMGGNKESVQKRVADYKLEEKGFKFQAFPVQFWDVFGEQGTPVRTTVANMGALLIGRLLMLNDTQSAVLTIIFKIAKDENLELIDLKDLQKIVQYVGDNSSRFTTVYGNISTASVGAIQRGLVSLEQSGASFFFGEPALNIDDLVQTEGAKGVVNIFVADKLMNSPLIYSTFLLWLMTSLFDKMPEVGDLEKPKLVFFFDEAHLLFDGAPKVLVDKIEQTVRLIRSKGIGIYFITQSPSDIPDSVLGQLGNRIQHALRAYTPKDQKALKAAAQTFRANEKFDTEKAISELETGEALISFLDEKGAPCPVERAYILPPEGKIGSIDVAQRTQMMRDSILNKHYTEIVDRRTAYELLTEQNQNVQDEKQKKAQVKEDLKKQKEQEKVEREESRQRKWLARTVITSAVIPIAKQLLRSFFKSKK